MTQENSDYFDKREIQDIEAREASLFGQLPSVIDHAKNHAPTWTAILKNIDASDITDRESLAQLPVMRKEELVAHQKAQKPFGGLNVTASGAMKHLFMSPGPVFEPGGRGKDWWNAARALYAAGFRQGDIVHNSFSYHLTPAGMMFESGAESVGCAVIPAGVGQTEQQIEVASHFSANAFTGIPDFLNIMLEKSDEAGISLVFEKAMVSGAALFPNMRQKFVEHGIKTFQCYGTADLGVVAYESPALEGMILSEDIIFEIVVPGTNRPVPEGDVGEIVVTRLNKDYPLIRFGTGDMTAYLPGISPCGRTNSRIKGWMGRADQRTKVKGMFVDPAQIALLKQQIPELGRVRVVITRENDQDVMTVNAEATTCTDEFTQAIEKKMREITKLSGQVLLAKQDSLPNDGKIIDDQRPIETG